MSHNLPDSIDGVYLEINTGWFPRVHKLIDDLKQVDPNLEILQIKEKFGGLRVYVSTSADTRDTIHEMIYQAENDLRTVCDKCGGPGSLRDRNGWLATRCDEHA